MPEAEIRSVLVPLTGVELLIPNATVAEVVGYSRPDPIEDAPDWLLGSFLWRGWSVPLIAYAVMIDTAESESLDGARICITKSLIENPRMPYVAILTQGFPRLFTVTEAALTEVPEEHLPIAVAGRVILGDREACIPDLDRMNQLVAHAAFGSLPLTT